MVGMVRLQKMMQVCIVASCPVVGKDYPGMRMTARVGIFDFSLSIFDDRLALVAGGAGGWIMGGVVLF
jgi:hypothetical protein